MRLPQIGFRSRGVRSGMVGLMAAIVAIGAADDPPREERDFFLEFLVVAGDTGLPVVNANVVTSYAFSGAMPPWSGRTGPDGLARLKGHFKFEDDPPAFGKSGKFAPWGRWLEVSAPGFETSRVPLHRVLGLEIDLDGMPPTPVRLTRGLPLADRYEGLKGSYRLPPSEYYGSNLELKADGRFAWYEWSHQGADAMEYGEFRRVGDRIELTTIPSAKPRDKTSIRDWYRIIDWGDEIFICKPGYRAPRDLARWAFRPPGAEPLGVFSGAYCREGRKPGGLPRLTPSEWARFAIGEIADRNDTRGVAQAWSECVSEAANIHLGGHTLRFMLEAIFPELAPKREEEI